MSKELNDELHRSNSAAHALCEHLLTMRAAKTTKHVTIDDVRFTVVVERLPADNLSTQDSALLTTRP